ncbi:hypothetical protein Glove_65g74 [Diversispora epigaea]|uniref:Uncharacterized protein n=1 Tax=Diversispora epigaea TaxID=1348612 RepID=A0A397JBV2_9GLOM|nr:hypothetical protein Glove_65g74 [Diversispora epigaea]
MTSEIKENEIDTSNGGVTHLEFVGDRTSGCNHEIFACKDITLLEKILKSFKPKKSQITYYSKLSDKKILCVLRSYPNINFEQSKSLLMRHS